MDIDQLIRENIKNLKPYSSARDEYSGEEAVFLDANENPFNEPVNRYPDPLQRKLKERIAEIKSTGVENIFLGNGSDEAIDLIIRVFCEPRQDAIVIVEPTYGMYEVAASVNDVEVQRVSLSKDFQLIAENVMDAVRENTKLLFLCSPNNPTANSFGQDVILDIINRFNGIVIIDEAYIDFSQKPGFLAVLKKFPQLVILQTFSKAWGLAGIRLGMAFAHPKIIAQLNKIKYPYNVNFLTQAKALEALDKTAYKGEWVKVLLGERDRVMKQLSAFSFFKRVYPSDANFILVKAEKPREIYLYLVKNKIIIRDRSTIKLCEGCLRITIGTKKENDILLEALKKYEQEQ